MLIKQLLEVYDVLDDSNASGETVEAYLRGIRRMRISTYIRSLGQREKPIWSKSEFTEAGERRPEEMRPHWGFLGRLGGLGARPERIGFVSDGDGALVALSLAAKLLDMQNKGDILEGDIIVSTHVSRRAYKAPQAGGIYGFTCGDGPGQQGKS